MMLKVFKLTEGLWMCSSGYVGVSGDSDRADGDPPVRLARLL